MAVIDRKPYIKELYKYENDALVEEMENKEELVTNLFHKASRCLCCKEGYFCKEDNGGDGYSYNSWYECNKCGSNPSPYREQMINDTMWHPECDVSIYEYMSNFCDPDRFNFEIPREKKRPHKEFDPIAWNKEKHEFYKPNSFEKEILTWDELVEREIKDYIEYLDKIIEKAKKYPLLRRMIK